MICPYCQNSDNFVLETRQNNVGQLRRRRRCRNCQGKFSTLEKICWTNVMVQKRDGRVEPFDREKVRRGMSLALKKRGIEEDVLELMTKRVEEVVGGWGREMVTAGEVGQEVMKELKRQDKIAYLRFTSVCRDFGSLYQFKQEMKSLEGELPE